MKILFWVAVTWTTTTAWMGVFIGEHHLSMWKFLAVVFMCLEELKSRKLEEATATLRWVADTLKEVNEENA